MSLELHQTPTGPLDGAVLQLPNTIDRRSVSGQVRFDYLNEPLVARLVGPRDSVTVPVVQHRLQATVSLAYGLTDQVMVYASLPVALYQTGDDPRGIPVDRSNTALGDLSLGINTRLYGGEVGFGLGLGIALVQPTGDEQSFMGDGRVGGNTHLRASWTEHRWSLAAHVGVSLRPSRAWVTHRAGSDLVAALGGFFWITNEVRLGLELSGVTGLTDRTFADASRSALELAISSRAKLHRMLFVQASVGTALIEAVGTPRLRASLSLGIRTDEGR